MTKDEKTIENLRYEIRHIRDPLKSKSDEWRETADHWLVTFSYDKGFFTVDYFTGSGHRKEKFGRSMAIKPNVKDVLYSLYIDSMSENENFHSWCANYGYSDDSISALNIYKECLDQSVKLRKLGLSRDYLEKLFENY